MAKNISRRDFLRLSSLTAAGSALAACAPKATPEPEVVAPAEGAAPQLGGSLEVILRHSFIPEMNAIQENQIALWGKANGVDVSVSSPGEWREMIAAGIDSKTGDIGETFQEEALIYGEALADVSDICEELGADNGGWYDLAESVGKDAKGVWRAIPRAYTTHVVNYRKDHFAEVGYEAGCETYDELLDAGTKLQNAGLPPLGFTVSQSGPNDSSSFCYSVLWSFGGAEVDDAGKVAINSDGTRAALEYMAKLATVSTPNITGFDEGANNRAFLAGEISATQNATSIYYKATGEVLEGMDHFKYPAGPAGWIQFCEMNTLTLFAHSKNLAAGKALLKYLMAPEQLVPLMQIGITFYTPLLKGYDDNPAMPWNVDPKLKVAYKLAEGLHLSGYPQQPSANSAKVYQNRTIVNMFARVVTGNATVDEAMTIAEDELKAVYG
jgi:multiple sugar transport system substrate-binding protein